MATEKVGVELFLENDKFTEEVKKTGNTFKLSTKKLEDNVKAVNATIKNQGTIFERSADKSVAALNEIGQASKKTNSVLIQNVKQTTKGLKGLGTSIDAQADQFKASSNEIVAAIRKIGTQTTKTKTKAVSNFAKTRKALDGVSKSVFSLRNGFLALGGSLIARQVLQVADAYTLLDSRLNLVVKDSEELAFVQERLLTTANETRQEYSLTATLYTRIARASKNLSESTEDLLGVTETLNKAIIISGASTQESSAAMTQFIQGIQSGTLRGQELNSVLEQTPRIAELIAEGLGKDIGQLRKMGEQGQLTAQIVIDAIQAQSSVIDKEFDGIAKTAGQSFVVLKNVVFDVINEINKSSGATSSLVGELENLTDLITENKTEIVQFFDNAVKGAKLLRPILAGIGSILIKTVEGYAKLAEAVELYNINADRQEEIEAIYAKTNRTLTEQARIVVDLQGKVNAGKSEDAGIFDSAELKRNITFLRLAEEQLAKMSKERLKSGKILSESAEQEADWMLQQLELLEKNKVTTVEMTGAKRELVKAENEYIMSIQKEIDRTQFLLSLTEQSVLIQAEGREKALAEIEFQNAALKSQAEIKIENAEVLQATLSQIDKNAAVERDRVNAEFDSKDIKRKKEKAQAERAIYFQTAALAVQALQEVFGDNKAFAISDIAIKTAQGVIGAFANSNPLPLQIAQAALIGTIGAAQSAKVAKQKFQDGGVIQGQSRTGDKISVAANAGEMVLNEGQQAELFSLANGGGNSGKREVIIISDVFSSEEVAQKIVNNNALAVRLGLEAQG